MALLFAGLGVWIAAHWLKRLAPGLRAGLQNTLGDASQGVVALALVGSIVLMVLGYRSADFIPLWQPPGFFTGINNLLMLLAFYTFGASARKTDRVWLGTKLRHPQLTGFKIWAVAHLLVNGDLASIILFGGLLAWAVGSVIIINRADGVWVAPARAPLKSEIILVVITLVLFSAVAGIHSWLGVWPFGG
ncbi:MAG: NnrU family protein [Pseudomonadota bacterium]